MKNYVIILSVVILSVLATGCSINNNENDKNTSPTPPQLLLNTGSSLDKPILASASSSGLQLICDGPSKSSLDLYVVGGSKWNVVSSYHFPNEAFASSFCSLAKAGALKLNDGFLFCRMDGYKRIALQFQEARTNADSSFITSGSTTTSGKEFFNGYDDISTCTDVISKGKVDTAKNKIKLCVERRRVDTYSGSEIAGVFLTEYDFNDYSHVSGAILKEYPTVIDCAAELANIPFEANFVHIKPGSFIKPENSNTIVFTRGFEIQTTEVTEKQWQAVMYGDDYNSTVAKNQVRWTTVQEFIKKLNKKQNVNLDCGTFEKARTTPGCYRLPTEMEWEYAARGGTTTAYSFGNDKVSKKEAAKYADFDQGYLDECNNTAKYPNYNSYVAKLLPNPWGLYDMHGNLSEWTQDEMLSNDGAYAKGPTTIIDPVVLATSPDYQTDFVVRGGSYCSDLNNITSSYRERANFSPPYVGFRLVRTAAP